MRNKIIYILLIIVLFSTNVSASLLVEQPYTTFGGLPEYIDQCSLVGTGPDAYYLCVSSHGVDSNPVSNLQDITVPDSWGSIQSIKFYMRRANSCIYTCDNDPQLSFQLYKSYTSSFASATLWDSATYNPSNTVTWSQFTFTPDYDLPVYNEFDEKIVNHIWIKLTSTGLNYSNIDTSRFIEVVYADTQDDKYPYGELYQSHDGTTYTAFNNPYNPLYAYDYYKTDLTFKVYGTFHVPQTPVPPPIFENPNSSQSAILPDGCSFEDYYNNLCSNLPDGLFISNTGAQYIPDYINDTNGTFCQSAECFNQTKITITTDDTGSAILKGFGYCTSTGCTLEDVFNLMYDSAEGLMLLSFMFVIYVIWKFFDKS